MKWIKQRKTMHFLLLSFVILICLSGCGRSRSHCYLCEGLAYEAPCLVDLATGDVAELKPRANEDQLVWTGYSSIMVEQRPDGSALAMIPDNNQEIAWELFCDSCIAALDATARGGYILADLADLNSIRLYTIEAEQSFPLRQYDVSIMGQNDSRSLIVEVRG